MHATRTPDGTDLIAKYRTILASPGRLVLDRSFISELVYGPLEHDRSRISYADAARLAASVSARGGLVVHLTGQPEKIAARLLARDGHATALQQLQAIIAAYDDVFTKLAAHANVITINTTTAGA